jgi:hypothetical protein
MTSTLIAPEPLAAERPLLALVPSAPLPERAPVKIKTKSQMYELYEAGAFGNKFRTWTSVEALAASGYNGTVTLRYASNKGGGGWCRYNTPLDEVETTVAEWIAEGADRKLVRANESAPDERLTVQGELQELPHGVFVFRFSTFKGKIRPRGEGAARPLPDAVELRRPVRSARHLPRRRRRVLRLRDEPRRLPRPQRGRLGGSPLLKLHARVP